MLVWVDYIIIGIIAFSALISLVRGFVKEALSLVIWISAFFVASNFYLSLADYFTKIQDQMLRSGTAIAVLFIATLIVGAVVNYVISQLVQKTGLSGTDRVLGVVFGGLRGVLIVSALLFCIDTFTGLSHSDWLQSSELAPHFEVVIKWFFQYIQETSSFLS